MKRVVINRAVVRGMRSVLNAVARFEPTPEAAQAKAFLEVLVERFDEKGLEEHELTLEPCATLEDLVVAHVRRHGPASLFGRIRDWTGAYPVEGPAAQVLADPGGRTGLGIDELDGDDLRALIVERDAKITELHGIIEAVNASSRGPKDAVERQEARVERQERHTIDALRAQIAAMQKLHAESRVEADLAAARQLLADRYAAIRELEAQLASAKAAVDGAAELERRLATIEAEHAAECEGYELALSGADSREAESTNLILAQAVVLVRELGTRVSRRSRAEGCDFGP